MHKHYTIKGHWVSVGAVWQIALGININKYSLSIELGPFYFTWEW
jgi:hypothetical protein